MSDCGHFGTSDRHNSQWVMPTAAQFERTHSSVSNQRTGGERRTPRLNAPSDSAPKGRAECRVNAVTGVSPAIIPRDEEIQRARTVGSPTRTPHERSEAIPPVPRVRFDLVG